MKHRVHERRALLIAFLVSLAGCEGDKPVSGEGVEQVPAPPVKNTASPLQSPQSTDPDETTVSAVLIKPGPTTVQPQIPLTQDARTNRETELRQSPDLASTIVRILPDASAVFIKERRGGWYLVRVSTDEGWVRLMHLTRTGTSRPSSASVVDEISAIATGRAGTGNIASTTGIRGLNAENLQLASPDMAALSEQDHYAISSAQAADAAAALGLTARRVAYLSELKK